MAHTLRFGFLNVYPFSFLRHICECSRNFFDVIFSLSFVDSSFEWEGLLMEKYLCCAKLENLLCDIR